LFDAREAGWKLISAGDAFIGIGLVPVPYELKALDRSGFFVFW
jgi:hypothetical protein